MKILISLGVLIIFISVFFVLFTVDGIVNRACTPLNGGFECSIGDIGSEMLVGTVIILMFILIDMATIYLIFTNVMRAGKI